MAIRASGESGSGNTGISRHNEVPSSFTIHPNPAQDMFTITGLSSGAGIRIMDMTGKIVYSAVATGYITTIPATDLVNGIYFISTGGNPGAASIEKLVVNK